MVIQKFNKFIRNKWAWGAVAVLFCLMFVGSDIVSNLAGRGGPSATGAGMLDGKEVAYSEFNAFLHDAQVNDRSTADVAKSSAQLNRAAWEACAAYRTAVESGVEITDDQLRQMLEMMFSSREGTFDFNVYTDMVRSNFGVTPEAFEEMLRRRMTVSEGIERAILGSAVWVSPMEVDQFVADMTDVFSVSVAEFTEDKKAAAAIKVDEAGLKKWYDENKDSINLPERIKIRYVKFDATATNILAKMVVTEDDMRDYYDANSEKYPSTDTNDVNGVKKFEVVKADIEKELRRIEAVNYFETNLNVRLYADQASVANLARIEAIAKADNLSVKTSEWFSVEGKYVDGFMKPAMTILGGAKNFLEVAAELDSSVEDLRYGIVSSDRAVWIIEKIETSPAHLPTFEESRGKIDNAALKDAREKAFEATVEAVAAKGVKEILATKNVLTNITFSVADIQSNSMKDQTAVVRAATKLKAGEVSKFTRVGNGRAILVVCDKRDAGDVAKAVMMRTNIRDQAAMMQQRELAANWRAWNLNRMNVKTNPGASMEEATEGDAE